MKALNDILDENISPATAAFISRHKIQVHDDPHNPGDGVPHKGGVGKDKSRAADQDEHEDVARYDSDPRIIDIKSAMADAKAEFNKIYGVRNSGVFDPNPIGRSVREEMTPEMVAARAKLSEENQQAFDRMFEDNDLQWIEKFMAELEEDEADG